jgi:hypothetical protein
VAAGIQPFVQSQAARLGYQWLRLFKQQVVELRARLTANFENVFEAGRRHQGDAPSFALKQGVRAYGGAADKFEAG